jgi:catechol 2,3-dioxygenase-like lactoylglutathione lyase family enzyme
MSVVHSHTFQHAGLPVNDLQKAKDFYVDVLGLKVGGVDLEPGSRQLRLYCGDDPETPGQQLVLFLRANPIERDTAENRVESLRLVEQGDTVAAAKVVQDGRTHTAFVITPEEFETALVKFKEMGIPYCKEVPRGNHQAMYFFDPDGNQLQLTDHL